ncbi:AbrB family transcriptional regulator [Alkalinema sp. FACHB-956]|uniref:AbrB family transcriptional regulator n=1 Tax=Alkalinema sp. FACHB-956 TaxID=2692768 RepID=UPI001684B85C|nr:AbrB family transcriptional regulator [Alkalinema sp. FACHB-956]MBD2327411.1 AbrB family transcriptional regulator [Alkalinema sp. FACHB-956]
MTETATAPLTGKALLQKVKDLAHCPRREKAMRCGYYTVSKTKKVRVNFTEFYDALLAAQGLALDASSAKDSRGREASYRVTVHKNGQIIIGTVYTQEMNLQPGDQFLIKLGYKHIHLIQVDKTDDLGDDDET